VSNRAGHRDFGLRLWNPSTSTCLGVLYCSSLALCCCELLDTSTNALFYLYAGLSRWSCYSYEWGCLSSCTCTV